MTCSVWYVCVRWGQTPVGSLHSLLYTHACNEPVHQNKISQTYMDFLEITVNHHKHLWIKNADQYTVSIVSKHVEQSHRVNGRGGKGVGVWVWERNGETAGLNHPYRPMKDEVSLWVHEESAENWKGLQDWGSSQGRGVFIIVEGMLTR